MTDPEMTDPKAVAGRALGLLDLTDLNDGTTAVDTMALCGKARTPHGTTAAVCLWPRFVGQAKSALAGSGVKIATVTNFPHGEPDAGRAAEETRAAFAMGADEVDVVIPYKAILANDDALAAAVVAACKAQVPEDRILKVILETGELKTTDAIGRAARIALDEGADFLKTSTGKVPVNATLEATEQLLQMIKAFGKPGTGFKAAGGIKTTADAGAYLAMADRIMGQGWATPATFRFGASGLLADLLSVLDGGSGAASTASY